MVKAIAVDWNGILFPKAGNSVAFRRQIGDVDVERALDAADEGDIQQQKMWSDKASGPVDEIEQLYGSPENIKTFAELADGKHLWVDHYVDCNRHNTNVCPGANPVIYRIPFRLTL